MRYAIGLAAALVVGSAALTTPVLDGRSRARMFRGYDDLDGITQAQRIGATFEIDGDLRAWFQALAEEVIASLDELAAELDDADV